MSLPVWLLQQMKCNNRPVAQQIDHCQDKSFQTSWMVRPKEQVAINWYNTGRVVQAPLG